MNALDSSNASNAANMGTAVPLSSSFRSRVPTSLRRSCYRGLLASWLLLTALPGCGDKESPPELMTLEGKIEKLERTSDKTGKLTVLYYNERQKQEMLGTGDVTAETEIMMDGAIATLADLHEGQHVRGDVRIEKKGGKKVQTVVRVRVERAKSAGSGN